MSNVMRALLDEAERMEVPAEPPAPHAEPVEDGETVVGLVPKDVRKLMVLAHAKTQELLAMGSDFDIADDPDGMRLIRIYRLATEMHLLEMCIYSTVKIMFLNETECEGTLYLRAGWQVSWSPECEDESAQYESRKRVLSS